MEEKFINMVMQYSFLYDKTNASFKDAKKKTRTWETIGQEFVISGEAAQKYFKSLREKYLRIKKEKELCTRSGSAGGSQKDWHLYELLRFLDEVVRPRKTSSNILEKYNQPELSTEIENVSVDDLHEANIESPDYIYLDLNSSNCSSVTLSDVTGMNLEENCPSTSSATIMPKHKSNVQSKQSVKRKRNVEENVSNALETIARSLQTSNKTNEYIHSFCQQIEQEMLKMSEEVMEDFKDEVYEILIKKRKSVKEIILFYY